MLPVVPYSGLLAGTSSVDIDSCLKTTSHFSFPLVSDCVSFTLRGFRPYKLRICDDVLAVSYGQWNISVLVDTEINGT
mgnify:CR=1 FL=1